MQIVLRIRTPRAKPVERGRRPNRRLALLGASLLLLGGWLSLGVCLWRWAFELGLSGGFPIPDGLLSHWQVWFLGGVGLNIAGVSLARYAEPSGRPAC